MGEHNLPKRDVEKAAQEVYEMAEVLERAIPEGTPAGLVIHALNHLIATQVIGQARDERAAVAAAILIAGQLTDNVKKMLAHGWRDFSAAPTVN